MRTRNSVKEPSLLQADMFPQFPSSPIFGVEKRLDLSLATQTEQEQLLLLRTLDLRLTSVRAAQLLREAGGA